jgi:hypothetical protein
METFVSAFDQPIAKVPPQGYWRIHNSHAAEPGKQLHHGGVLFLLVDTWGSSMHNYSYVGNKQEIGICVLCYRR